MVGGENEKWEDEEGDLGKEEIRKALDVIPAEVWKYGGEEVRGWVDEKCRRIWRGEGWPKKLEGECGSSDLEEGKRGKSG